MTKRYCLRPCNILTGLEHVESKITGHLIYKENCADGRSWFKTREEAQRYLESIVVELKDLAYMIEQYTKVIEYDALRTIVNGK